jgi:hypothetical protein
MVDDPSSRSRGSKGIPKLPPSMKLERGESRNIPKLSPAHAEGKPKPVLMAGSRLVRSNSPTGFTSPTEFLIGRVVVVGPPPMAAPFAEELLLYALGPYWPEGALVQFLITPGGFLRAPWPANWTGTSGWGSRHQDFSPLAIAAEKELFKALTPQVFEAAAHRTRFLTVAVDLFAGKTFDDPHAELVALVDVAKRKVLRWTGKSYPVAKQERGLVQETDLRSHVIKVDKEQLLILGCHDLNMFSARAYKNQATGSFRRNRTQDMRGVAQKHPPTLVIQHPHLTDSPRVWSTAWGSLQQIFPNVKAWASGICFYNPKGERAALDAVLAGTRSASNDVLDIIVYTHR